MKADILCMGNASYDIYFPMDGYPQEDQKYMTETFLEACGGPAANAAYLLGKWKASCAFAGCVGSEDYGRKIYEEFRKIGVKTDLLEIRENYHTPLSCILTNSLTGSRTIINRRIISNDMQIDTEVLRKGRPRFLHFDSHEYKASLTAMDLFPDAVSILDAGSPRKQTMDLAKKVTHLLCSESFALAATEMERLKSEEDLRECAACLMEINSRPGCFTLGERGLVFWQDGEFFLLPAFPVIAVDSTAAGDIFHGAFVYSLSRGAAFTEALVTGSAAAALSVEKPGGRPSIPTVEEVVSFIENHKRAGTLPQPRLR